MSDDSEEPGFERTPTSVRRRRHLEIVEADVVTPVIDLRDVLDPVSDRLADVERVVASHRRLIRWVGGVAIASLVTVGTFLYARGVSEGGAAIRLEHLEKAVDELRGDARAAGRHSSTDPAIAPDAISSATQGTQGTP